MTERSANRLPLFAAGLAFFLACTLPFENAVADHGGSHHVNLGLTVPASSSTGHYTVRWNGSPSHTLQEKVGTGSYTNAGSPAWGSKSFSNKPNGTYTYRVRKETCTVECTYQYTLPQSITVSIPPPPPILPPTGLTGPSLDYDGSFTISWNASVGATSYILQRKFGSGSWSQVYSGSATSKAETSLTSGIAFSYRVQACSTGCSAWSSTHVTTTAPMPAEPTGLTTPVLDYNGAYTVSWNTSANSTLYQLERKPSGGSWAQIYSGSGTSKAESSMAVGLYFYRVRGCNVELRCSGWSAESNARVVEPPATPTGLTGPTTDYNGAYTVSWNTSARSTSYQLQRRLGSGSWAQVYSGNSTSQAESSMAAGVYSYRVRGCNIESVCSGWSSTHATTVQAPPSTPSGLTGPGTDYDGSYSVSWNSSTNSTSYQLQRRLGSNAWLQVLNYNTTSKAEYSLAPGTYTYRVRGCNVESVCSGWSSTHATTVQEPPGGPYISSPGSTEYDVNFTVAWNAVTNATRYELQRRPSTGSWTQIYSGTATSYAETSVTPGTWHYSVRGCNPESVCGGWSGSRITTVIGPPAAPTGLTGPATDYNGSYSLSWNSVTDATSYRLQRRLGSGAWSQVYSGDSTGHSESSLPAGTYSYQVRGCNVASVCGSWSATHVTVAQAAPSTPTGVTGPATDANGSFTVSWNSSTNSTSYQLQRKLDAGAWSTVYTGSATSQAQTTLPPGAHSFQVRGCNVESVCSGWSAVHVTVVEGPPSVPSGLTGPATDYNGSYTVSWNTSANSTGYELERRLGGGAWSTIHSAAGTSVAESSMAAGTYSYRVRGCNDESVCSSWSATHTTTVEPSPSTPTGLTGPTTDSNGTFAISWDASAYSTSYHLERRFNGGPWTRVYTGSETSAREVALSPGTYTYSVRGCNAEVLCSGWSSTHDVVVPQGAGDWQTTDAGDFPDAGVINPTVPTGDVGNNSVGALRGSGSVSGGQASYSIPVVVPPGRKGMQPSVSLNYSSSGGNGVAGVGWGLTAVSAISRCAATPVHDGFTAAVQYDSSRDRLCLDGRRLVVTSGNYGSSGAVYRTELDVFARITQFGGMNDPTTYFTVDYKDNRIAYFGYNAGSRHSASGRSQVLTWAISDMQDRSGNTITYDYVDHGDGEHNIEAIHYTGINGAAGDRHVRFGYEPRPDVRTSYMAGGKTRSTQRLKTIRTEYQSTLVREYTLDYGAVSLSSSRSLLRGVQECAFENGVTAHCLPPTTFEWQEATPRYVGERLQFSDPNNLIQGTVDPTTGREIIHIDERKLQDVMPHGDQNGDGVKDWAGLTVNAEGEVTGTHANTLANCFRSSNAIAVTCLQADFNADGLTDSIRSNNQVFEYRLSNYPGEPVNSWVATGVKWGDNGPQFGTRHDHPLAFADFNGDGWVDMAIKQNSQLWIYFHSQSLTGVPYTNSDRRWLLDYGISSGGGYYETTNIQIPGDMDGNGTPDIVVSRPPGGGEAPGLPVPNYMVLTFSMPGGGMIFTTRSFTNLAVTPTMNAHFFHDVNGDGLQDLVSVSPTTENLQYRPNTGLAFETNWLDLGFGVPMRTGTYQPAPQEWEDFEGPAMSKILVMDYDGDGKQEILFANTVLASSCALTTQGPGLPNVWKCDDDLYGEYDEVNPFSNYWPINSGVLDNSIRNFRGYRLVEDASGNITGVQFATSIYGSASQTAVVDATGDGLPDIVTVQGCRPNITCEFNQETAGRPGTRQSSTRVPGAYLVRNVGTAAQTGAQEFEFAGYDLMNVAEDGFGNRDEWTYKPLSSDAYDTADSDYYKPDHKEAGTYPDYFHFASSMNVVADHRASNGVGGLNSTKYRYRGAMFNNKGRGFQGFKSIIAEEDVYGSGHALAGTDKVTRTDFHQQWPLSGQVDKACTWLATDAVTDDNPACASVLSLTTVNSIRNVATSGGARFVAVEDQTAETFDLVTRASVITRRTQRGFDDAGNVTSETVDHTDDWTTNNSQTTRSYTLDWVNWWLNRVDSQTVTHNPVTARHVNSPAIASGTDGVKSVTTNYTQYYATQRLPSTVVVSSNDSLATLTTVTQYNARGLPTQVSVTGTGVTGPRTVDTNYSDNGTVYSPDGYFPFTITNALGHESEQHTDPKHGQPTSQWDANGLVTTTAYDAFGRVSELTPPGQPTAHQRHFWCGGATSCPSGAAFAVKTYRAGAPETHSFLDQFGRELQSSSQNFAGTGFVNVSTSYDERGNTTFTSVPYDPGAGEPATIGTRFLSFDALGRLQSKEIDQSGGGVFLTSYSYSGLQTSINAGGLLMHRIYNGLEQLVETQDAEGGYTRYAYDGAGNPIAVQDPNLNTITASYNAFGHKGWVNDPNMGLKTFDSNVLGEVGAELDANGNTISLQYDVLGRLRERSVNGALTGSWHYDNGAADKGLGLLDYEDSHLRSDGSGLRKYYFYSSVASGRKDLTRVRHSLYTSTPANATDYDVDYFTDSYYARPKGVRYPGGIGVAFAYNSGGYLTHELDASSTYVIRQVTARDSRNRVKTASLNDGLLNHSADYYDASGQMRSIAVTGPGGSVHDLYYEYDVFGNLDYQRTTYAGATSTESFTYDNLHRLTQSTRVLPSGSSTINYAYDAAGNLTLKDDYASVYTYNPGRPNAVASVTKVGGGGTVTFGYDANGNLTTGDGKTLTYNAFNKPTSITAGGITSGFFYGSDLSRYKQTKSNGETILYLDKLMEIVTVGSTTDYRHYISDVAILTKTGALNDPSPSISFLHRDRLGSLATITDEMGLNAQARGFDPFGKPRDGDWADRSPSTLDSVITDRGFTEHEHLDESQLIHMNGRVYDYNLGRFLSVDPFIQAPGNSQSLNPYSYIMNNPLGGVDPSGYTSCSGDDKRKCSKEIEVTTADGSVHTVTATLTADGDNVTIVFTGQNMDAVQKAAEAGVSSLQNNDFGSIEQIGGQVSVNNTYFGPTSRGGRGSECPLGCHTSGIEAPEVTPELIEFTTKFYKNLAEDFLPPAGIYHLITGEYYMTGDEASRVLGAMAALPVVGAAKGGARPLFRAMRKADDGTPEVGPSARSLGARPDVDIPVDCDGCVHPGTGGVSASPDSPSHLPPHRRPQEFGGTGKDPVWKIESDSLGDDLRFVPDSKTHGTIQPSRSMTLEEYQQALGETVYQWERQ